MRLNQENVFHQEVPPNKPNGADKDHVRLSPLRDLSATMQPAHWLWKPVLQRGLFYALCAHPGAGKTAIALLAAFLVDLGRSLDFMRMKKGRVIYFVGEGIDDMRYRAEAMYSFLRV